MALQDDFFDVAEALMGRPELAAFRRIEVAFNNLEKNTETYENVFNALGKGLKALRYIEEEFKS